MFHQDIANILWEIRFSDLKKEQAGRRFHSNEQVIAETVSYFLMILDNHITLKIFFLNWNIFEPVLNQLNKNNCDFMHIAGIYPPCMVIIIYSGTIIVIWMVWIVHPILLSKYC